jgi:hypothetical protein
VHDRPGLAIWSFTSEKTGDEAKDDTYNPYSPIFLPWRDIAVRLSYVHLIDNTIHFIWFRYFIAEAPYTSYINNSEILTMLLGATLAVYTYARMRTHVYFSDDEAGLVVDIKSPIPPVPQPAICLLSVRPISAFAPHPTRGRRLWWCCACWPRVRLRRGKCMLC